MRSEIKDGYVSPPCDAMNLRETAPARHVNGCSVSVQIPRSRAIAKEYIRQTLSPKSWTPGQAVDTRNGSVEQLSPGASVRVLGRRRMDQFAFRDRSGASGNTELTKLRVYEFDHEQFACGPQLAVAPFSQLAPWIGGGRNVLDVLKHALGRCCRERVGSIQSRNVCRWSTGKRIKSRTIL